MYFNSFLRKTVVHVYPLTTNDKSTIYVCESKDVRTLATWRAWLDRDQ